MPDREKLITVCQEWVIKADNDLTNAAHTLKLGESCPTDTVCYHALTISKGYCLLFLRSYDQTSATRSKLG